MFGRTSDAGSGGDGAAAGSTAGASGTPNLTGDLDGLLSNAPYFRTRLGGYDRLQVDNYVAWVESELSTGRREIEHLLARYGVCSAELEISRRLLAQAPKGIDPSPVSDRVRQMFRLAADEANAMIDAAGQEADHLLAEARAEADARLRKAHEIKELAADTADEMLAQARRERAEATALVRTASSERDRLTAEAAEAGARLAALQAELEELHRQRDEARSSLGRLTDLLGQALDVVSGGVPEQYLLVDNHVADSRVESVSS